jgi:putative CocE/NonD family hydrolase
VNVKTDFPRRVREIKHVWIPMSDGVRLSARIWLPDDAQDDPVPAILEYVPYRKDDGTEIRDAMTHPYFAGHGYASIRVDLRGSGDSEGLLLDEYLLQEQDDALDVLRWIAEQPWCSGSIGMIGISWGGFNGLQVAARRPPELKAVISMCSTDDRFSDDVHYLGGCVLGSGMLYWGATMLVYNGRPADPAIVGSQWREQWLERLEKTPPFVEAWLSHQRRDDYWRHASIAMDYDAVQTPVYMVGGWGDPYRTAQLRAIEHLSCPRKALIGPWAHRYPSLGIPGPAIGFSQECLRWWDHWLKGIDTGIMDEPMVRVWVQERVAPRPVGEFTTDGFWVTYPTWPASEVQQRSFTLTASGGLELTEAHRDDAQSPRRTLSILGDQSTGTESGRWCPHGAVEETPLDQRLDDARSLTFDTEPLSEPMHILGRPEVRLTLSSDQENALVAVRLCDVGRTGESALISIGLLNLTHRGGHDDPQPLEPGKQYDIAVRLYDIGQTVAPGHRIRLAISPTYWPWAWPSPQPATLNVLTGHPSVLALPLCDRPEVEPPPFGDPEVAPSPAIDRIGSPWTRTIERDAISGVTRSLYYNDDGSHRRLEDGHTYRSERNDVFTIVDGDPLSAEAQCDRTCAVERGDWKTSVVTKSRMTADRHDFHVINEIEAHENGSRVFKRTWAFRVPRDLV